MQFFSFYCTWKSLQIFLCVTGSELNAESETWFDANQKSWRLFETPDTLSPIKTDSQLIFGVQLSPVVGRHFISLVWWKVFGNIFSIFVYEHSLSNSRQDHEFPNHVTVSRLRPASVDHASTSQRLAEHFARISSYARWRRQWWSQQRMGRVSFYLGPLLSHFTDDGRSSRRVQTKRWSNDDRAWSGSRTSPRPSLLLSFFFFLMFTFVRSLRNTFDWPWLRFSTAHFFSDPSPLIFTDKIFLIFLQFKILFFLAFGAIVGV